MKHVSTKFCANIRVKHAQRSLASGQRQLLRSFGFSTAGDLDPRRQ